MRQLELAATEKPGLSALSADAKAVGELKRVAELVFPKAAKKDPEKARDDLADALRPSHARKLDIDEAAEIIVESIITAGRSSVIEYIFSRVPKDCYEFRWVPKQEQVERIEKRIEDRLDSLSADLQAWKAARAAK